MNDVQWTVIYYSDTNILDCMSIETHSENYTPLHTVYFKISNITYYINEIDKQAKSIIYKRKI